MSLPQPGSGWIIPALSIEEWIIHWVCVWVCVCVVTCPHHTSWRAASPLLFVSIHHTAVIHESQSEKTRKFNCLEMLATMWSIHAAPRRMQWLTRFVCDISYLSGVRQTLQALLTSKHILLSFKGIAREDWRRLSRDKPPHVKTTCQASCFPL